MKLKYNFVTNEIAGKIVAVAVGEDAVKFNGFIKMNETGAEIFKLLKEDITLEGLIDKLVEIYPDSDREAVKNGAITFIDGLKQYEVLI